MSEKRRYVHIPRDLRPALPRLTDMLREAGVARSYDFIAQWLDVKPETVQKCVLNERAKQ